MNRQKQFQLSLKQSIIGIILAMGLITIVLVLIITNIFQHFAHENKIRSNEDIVHIAAGNILVDLTRTSQEMAETIIAQKNFRKNFTAENLQNLSQILNDQFRQYYTTAGVVDLIKIHLFDKNMKLLAQSFETPLHHRHQNIYPLLCNAERERARKRTGIDRLKLLAGLCSNNGYAHQSVIVPIGGIVPRGYLQIISDPAYSLQQLADVTGLEIRLTHPGGKQGYQTVAWPERDTGSFLISEHILRTENKEPALTISVAENTRYFNQQIGRTSYFIGLVAFIITVPAFLLAISIIGNAFQPLRQIGNLTEEALHDEDIGIEKGPYIEVNNIIDSYNRMTGNIRELVLNLEEENAHRKMYENQLLFQQHALEEAKDKALRASEAKSSFLANMSHEIRTPLTAVIGFGESLQDPDITTAGRIHATETIIRSGKHLLKIINDILDLSKIEANKLDVDCQETSPAQVVREISALVKHQCDEKGISLVTSFEFPLPERVWSDPLRLKQIIINLCSNAIKFTEAGSITVTTSYSAKREELNISVTDTGIGMTASQMKEIFHEFSQADASTTRKYGGTGLGLTLSRRLAEMMGGSLEVESEPDLGSTFILTVQAPRVDDCADFSSHSAFERDPIAEPADSTDLILTGRVLLAEDTIENQELISMYIRKLGKTIHIDIAENGQEAVYLAQKHTYDLVFMDIQMPVMNGLDATRMIREKDTTTPVYALTANAMREDQEACYDAGCTGFLVKPVDRKALNHTLSQYLATAPDESTAEQIMVIHSDILQHEPDMADIVNKFLSRLPEMLDRILQANIEGDITTLKAELHKLKGIAGGVGYPVVTQLIKQIEQQLRNENTDQALGMLGELEKTCRSLVA